VQITSWRVQIKLVALGYAAVSVVAAALLIGRHMQELMYPADASGGMWAFGDAILYIFIACLFMVPTGFLIWATAQFEAYFTGYSIFLLGLSLSSPVCLIVLHFGEKSCGAVVNQFLFLQADVVAFYSGGNGHQPVGGPIRSSQEGCLIFAFCRRVDSLHCCCAGHSLIR
jgi:hypothetical protein